MLCPRQESTGMARFRWLYMICRENAPIEKTPAETQSFPKQKPILEALRIDLISNDFRTARGNECFILHLHLRHLLRH